MNKKAKTKLSLAILILFSIIFISLSSVGVLAARTIAGVTLDGESSVTVLPGTTVNVSVTVHVDSGSKWDSTKYQIGSGNWTCINHADHHSHGTYTESFSVTAPFNMGTYNLNITTHSNDVCSRGTAGIYNLNNAIIVVQCLSDDDCDYLDAYYCGANLIEHDEGVCIDNICSTETATVEDCDDYDDWYDTENTQWIETGQCTQKEQKEQAYYDFYCSEGEEGCSYELTEDYQWVDTENSGNKEDGTECNDEQFCTVDDQCIQGFCSGAARDCSDGIDCTQDSCDENADECANVPDDSICDNSLWCDGAETCYAALDCQEGTPPVTDDGINCTIDSCDEENDKIIHTPVTDSDGDGIADCIDNILGTSSDIQTNNGLNLSFSVSNVVDETNYSGIAPVKIINKDTQKTLVEFNYNFSSDTMNLSDINITVNSNAGEGSIIIRGINLTGQNITKTAYIDKVGTSSTVCIIDENVASITVTDDCTNGVKITCDGTNGGYTCTAVENGTRYKITGLTHSAVTQYSYTAPIVTLGGGGVVGGGGCLTEWICTDWSDCVNGSQTRTCSKIISYCAATSAKPSESQSCSIPTAPATPVTPEVTPPTPVTPGIIGAVIRAIGGAIKKVRGVIIFIAALLVAVIIFLIVRKGKKGKRRKK